MASHLHDKEMVQTAAVSNRLRRWVTLFLGGPNKTVAIWVGSLVNMKKRFEVFFTIILWFLRNKHQFHGEYSKCCQIKIRLVLISSSAIAKHAVIITIITIIFFLGLTPSFLAARGLAAHVLKFRVQ